MMGVPKLGGKLSPNALWDTSKVALTLEEAARILDCDPRTVSRAIAKGAIPSITIGRRKLIPIAPFKKLLGIEF